MVFSQKHQGRKVILLSPQTAYRLPFEAPELETSYWRSYLSKVSISVTRDLTTLKANDRLGFCVEMDVLDVLFMIYDSKAGKG